MPSYRDDKFCYTCYEKFLAGNCLSCGEYHPKELDANGLCYTCRGEAYQLSDEMPPRTWCSKCKIELTRNANSICDKCKSEKFLCIKCKKNEIRPHDYVCTECTKKMVREETLRVKELDKVERRNSNRSN